MREPKIFNIGKKKSKRLIYMSVRSRGRILLSYQHSIEGRREDLIILRQGK